MRASNSMDKIRELEAFLIYLPEKRVKETGNNLREPWYKLVYDKETDTVRREFCDLKIAKSQNTNLFAKNY